MKMCKGESMKKYEKVWRLKTRCHRRWMDPARQEKREGGYFVPVQYRQRLRFI